MNLDKYLQTLKQCQLLQQNDVKLLCDKAKQILSKEPNSKEVKAPVTICGDIHGQFYDLLELFDIGGQPPYTNYLFLGDYVDRGFNGVEVFSLILALKVKHKDRITILRGNHQNKQINKSYGFYDQCIRKYSNQNVWKLFTDIFQYLPLAATVEKQFFCLHGGLSPDLNKINQIKHINRIRQVPRGGVMCDLLWSDPEQNGKQGFQISPRGAGYIWGSEITQKFTHTNNLKMICRAHQLMMQGYKSCHKDKCMTIFSAPNYCYRCGNQASILQIDDLLNINIHQYSSIPRETQPHITRRIPQYFL